MKFLKHKLPAVTLVSVLVISIFMLFFAANISYKQIQSLTESDKLVVHSYKVYVELEQLNLYAKEAESSQRGFLLTKDSILLAPYASSLKKIYRSYDELKLLLSDNPEQERNLDTLLSLIKQRFLYLGEVLNINDPRNYDTMKNLIETGTLIMKEAQAQIDKMVSKELLMLKKREAEHENDIELSPFSILFIVLFSLLIFILSFFKINKDLKGLAKTNTQLLINNEIFEQSEQIADISHWYRNIVENKMSYSNNLYRLLGCNVNEFEPTFQNFLEYVHPDDRHLLMQGNQPDGDDSSSAPDYFRINRKDGSLRYFKSISKTITDTYGTKFNIGINADITDQNNKDKLIYAQLADLKKSNEQLSAFNHIASHDLQEPLRKVQVFISRIREKDSSPDPEKVKEYLSGIDKEAARMQKFIEDLIVYSRANKPDKAFERTDLSVILENSLRDLSQRIEEKNVKINAPSVMPVINAIPFQMQQLFINLLSNSIKYSKADGAPVIDINTKIVPGKDIPFPQEDNNKRYVQISFTDNGIGFEQKYAENIFTLFFRLHNNKDYSGTGIGLTICKLITDNHKGFILAEGIPDAGSTFSVFLPA